MHISQAGVVHILNPFLAEHAMLVIDQLLSQDTAEIIELCKLGSCGSPGGSKSHVLCARAGCLGSLLPSQALVIANSRYES